MLHASDFIAEANMRVDRKQLTRDQVGAVMFASIFKHTKRFFRLLQFVVNAAPYISHTNTHSVDQKRFFRLLQFVVNAAPYISHTNTHTVWVKKRCNFAIVEVIFHFTCN